MPMELLLVVQADWKLEYFKLVVLCHCKHFMVPLKSVFMHDCRCSGSKVKFSRWRQRPSWIWPPGKKTLGFLGRTWGLKRCIEVNQSPKHLSQRMVMELSLFTLQCNHWWGKLVCMHDNTACLRTTGHQGMEYMGFRHVQGCLHRMDQFTDCKSTSAWLIGGKRELPDSVAMETDTSSDWHPHLVCKQALDAHGCHTDSVQRDSSAFQGCGTQREAMAQLAENQPKPSRKHSLSGIQFPSLS